MGHPTMSASKPHKRPISGVGIDLLVEDCERTSAALSMNPTPFQLEQATNFLVATVPAALRNLEEQLEAAVTALQRCHNEAGGKTGSVVREIARDGIAAARGIEWRDVSSPASERWPGATAFYRPVSDPASKPDSPPVNPSNVGPPDSYQDTRPK